MVKVQNAYKKPKICTTRRQEMITTVLIFRHCLSSEERDECNGQEIDFCPNLFQQPSAF